ncbi:9111_t:CDS:2 [Ambispora gerdemannii]|uniref:9111_t:CDS:1 n=1 Tax=Ambispora gerdemannii TaxID=144530 RepID=A0A9N9CH87_9GLOM|nr:9111_t:CDS:2 [Ambispora gerdemannii]
MTNVIKVASCISVSFALLLLVDGAKGQLAGCQGVINVQDQSDISQLGGCTSFTGTIAITGTNLRSLSIPKIQTLHGTFTVQNNLSLVSLSLPDLKSASNLVFAQNKALSAIDVPGLKTVTTFNVNSAPSLRVLSFPAGLNSIENFELSDTAIGLMKGIDASRVGSLLLSRNENLKSLTLPNLLSAESLEMIGNGRGNFQFEANNLNSLGQGNFKNLASTALPSLNKVTSGLSYTENSFTTLSLPKLSEVGSTLTISSNPQLKSTSFPELSHIGEDLIIGNNQNLVTIDGFDKLDQIEGKAQLSGDFSTTLFPSLDTVGRGLNVESSSSSIRCNGFDKLRVGGAKVNNVDCSLSAGKKDPSSMQENKTNSNDDSNKAKSTNNSTISDTQEPASDNKQDVHSEAKQQQHDAHIMNGANKNYLFEHVKMIFGVFVALCSLELALVL